MARAPDSWMPLHVTDWRGGTLSFTAAERGAYLELILAYWEFGPLPADDAVLEQLSKCRGKEWKQVRAKVLAKFQERDGVLYQDRADRERAEATKRYEKRAAAGKRGGEAKAQHSSSNATAKPEPGSTTTLHNTTSANADSLPDGSEGRAPKPKGSRLASDWEPSSEDRAFAIGKNLNDAEIDGVAEQFREYWLSPDCPKPIKRDWAGTWRRWVARDASAVISRRPRNTNRSERSPQARQSVTAARDSILAKAGLRPHGEVQGLRSDENRGPSSHSSSEANSNRIIDADGWREVPGPTDGTESAYAPVAGLDGGPRGATGGVPQADDGLPGRRCSARPDDATRVQPMVAGVGGIEGAVGDPHVSTPRNAQGSDDGLDIPAFMRRTA